LEARISSREITEWEAYDAIEPIGPARTELLLCRLVHELLGAWLGNEAPGLHDLLPPWLQEDARSDPKDVMERLTAAVRAAAGRKDR